MSRSQDSPLTCEAMDEVCLVSRSQGLPTYLRGDGRGVFGEQEPGLPTYLRGDGRGVFGEQEPGLPTYLRGDGRGVFGEQEPADVSDPLQAHLALTAERVGVRTPVLLHLVERRDGGLPGVEVRPAAGLDVHLVDAPEVQLLLHDWPTHVSREVQASSPQEVEDDAEHLGVPVEEVLVGLLNVVLGQKLLVRQFESGILSLFESRLVSLELATANIEANYGVVFVSRVLRNTVRLILRVPRVVHYRTSSRPTPC